MEENQPLLTDEERTARIRSHNRFIKKLKKSGHQLAYISSGGLYFRNPPEPYY